MLIDMGGGTVDMTVYEVDSLAAADAMRMSELTHRECLAEVRVTEGLLGAVVTTLRMKSSSIMVHTKPVT
jgi:hypothetical protein